MHESVSASGTPRRTPSPMTSSLCIVANGAAIAIGCASPRESARDISSKNAGVASGNGLPASGPRTSRVMPRRAQRTAAFESSTMLRPSMYTSSSGVS